MVNNVLAVINPDILISNLINANCVNKDFHSPMIKENAKEMLLLEEISLIVTW